MFSAKLLTAALAFGGTQAVTIQAKPIMDYKACKAMCSTYPGWGKSRDMCFDECMGTPRLAQIENTHLRPSADIGLVADSDEDEDGSIVDPMLAQTS